MQLLSLLTKTDVHCVWLAKGGRKRLNTRELQLTIYLIMHGTILALMEAYSISVFQLIVEEKPHKKNGSKKLVAKE